MLESDVVTRWFPLDARGLALAGIVIFLAIYGSGAGLGFVGDDFAWVAAGATAVGERDPRGLVAIPDGFYRPLTTLSLGIDHALFGMNARGYGLMNLLLALACAGAITCLALALRLAWPAALGAAALWLFNFHGISMAVLVIGGRTALLLTGLAVLSAAAFVKGQRVLSLVLAGAAMFAHEQAVTLPAMMTTWLLMFPGAAGASVSLGAAEVPGMPNARGRDRRGTLAYLGGLWLVLGAYLWMRAGSGAFWFAAPSASGSAPAFSSFGRNLIEYADRSLTLSVVAVLLSAAYVRAWPRLAALPAHILSFGALWLAWGFGATLLLPERSSLFVLLPSVGATVVAAALVQAVLRKLDDRAVARAQLALVLVLVVLVPVHWSRNARWTDLARLSSTVMTDVREHAATAAGEKEALWIVDDTARPVTLADAWGSHTDDISRLAVGGRLQLMLTREANPVCSHPCTTVRLQSGRLVDWQASSPPPPPADPSLVRRALWDELQPVTLSNCRLQRFGEAADGGYLLCGNLLDAVKAGYSYGISGYDGWGCDVARIRKVPVHQYDCFNTTVPACKAQTVFHAECVGPRRETADQRPFDSVENHIAVTGHATDHVVVKMDVEGAEWDSLLATPDEVLERIDQLVIELHGTDDEKFVRVVRRLKQFFHVANLHMNNYACDSAHSPFPAWAYEALFVSRRLATTVEGVRPAKTYSTLDAPNTTTGPDCQAK